MSKLLAFLIDSGAHLSSMTADSRQVGKGSLFLAYPGEKLDGRDFIAQALEQGAAAVIWEQEGFTWNPQWAVPNMPLTALRKQAGVIADEFYGQPSQQLWMIGVTGTNGKTSCSQWLAQALSALGRKTAVVGTIGNGFPEALSTAINTTPDPIRLHDMLANYLSQGAQAVAMEVSSHGLDQGRLNGVHFDVAVLTNLTRDHLDYHGDMASYAAAKRALFDWHDLNCAVVNVDDAFGRKIGQELSLQGKQVLGYGLDGGDIRGSELQCDEYGISMQVTTPFGRATLRAPVLGRFNAYNVLAVLASLLASDVLLADAIAVLAHVRPVAGRMEQFGG
ncbi:MAG: Mur ligase family protein, partial [Methylophilaceae bacterium]